MNDKSDQLTEQSKVEHRSQGRHSQPSLQISKIINLLKQHTLSPGIEHSNLDNNMKLFNQTTTGTFNMAHNLSTLTSPFSKSRYYPFPDLKNESLLSSKGRSLIFNTFSDDRNESRNENHISDSAPYIIYSKAIDLQMNDVLVDAKHLDLKN